MHNISDFNKVKELIDEALCSINDIRNLTSDIARKAIRIATLRNDYKNLYWLKFELLTLNEKDARKNLMFEMAKYMNRDDFAKYHSSVLEQYMDEREQSNINIGEQSKEQKGRKVLAQSIMEIEKRKVVFEELLDKEQMNSYPFENNNTNEIMVLTSAVQELESIISRIRNRIFLFLCDTEKQIYSGHMQSDLYEKTMAYVNNLLMKYSYDTYLCLNEATKRIEEDNEEAFSQALTSCRRALKKLADSLYPHSDILIADENGKKRKMGEEQYVNRLWQYIKERIENSKMRNLIKAQVEDLGHRLDAIYALSSKGVHADVTKIEAENCLIQTYLLISEILRISENEMVNNEHIEDIGDII